MTAPSVPGALPERVRRRVVERAAACLGTLEPDQVPVALRRVARFEPRRRARLAGAQIAAALDRDDEFRGRVADLLRTEEPDLAAAVSAGQAPAAADPEEVAAAAYLLRPEGWQDLLADAEAATGKEAQERRAAAEVAKLRDRVEATRAEGERELARLATQLESARAEVRLLRGRVHDERQRTREAEARAEAAEAAHESARADVRAADDKAAKAAGETRRLRARVTEVEGQLEALRRSGRAERAADAARLSVLVDTLVDAAQGLRRELALPTGADRPADAVAGRYDTPGERRDADPGLLDRLLTVPQMHLVVDGYNVTKSGWAQLTLQEQRSRLLSGLTMLVAQTRVEVTCVFDGADLGGRVPVATARGVRVLFSPAGVTADEVIGDLVRAEPTGRRVVVVSSDGEVADATRRAGADALPAETLITRLTRG